jgi:hypothetical protein
MDYNKLYKENKSFFLAAKKEYLLLKKKFLEHPNPKNEKEIDDFWNKYFEDSFQFYMKGGR